MIATIATIALLAGNGWGLRPSTDELLSHGIAAAERGDTERAVEALDALLQRSPQHAEALLYRAQLAVDAGDAGLALEWFRRVPDLPARFGAPARYAEGVMLIERGSARRGERQLLRAVELNPGFAQPQERLVELYAVEMRRDDIRRQLDALRRLRPWSPEELVLYTVAGQRIEEVDAGVKRMRQFLQVEPKDRVHHMALARYLTDGDRLDEAADALAVALEYEPDSAEFAGLLARVRLRQQDAAGAAEVLARVEQVSSGSFWFWRSCGDVWQRQRDWARAAECFERAVLADPEDLSSAHALGVALGHLESGEAEFHVRRAELLDLVLRQSARIPQRQNSDAAFLVPVAMDVADGLLKLERNREAIYWFDFALIINPQIDVARHGLQLATERLRIATQHAPSKSQLKAHLPTLAASPDVALVMARLRPRPPDTASDADRSPPVTTDATATVTPLRFRDVHDAAGVDFQYFNGAAGHKYLLESMGGAVAVVDFDLDGWPDLFLPQGCPLRGSPDQPLQPDPALYRNRLFRNLGDGTFRDVTDAAGLGDPGYAQGCGVGDFDNDGDPDLFVANFGANLLMRNNGDGTFSDATSEAGVAGSAWSSSVAFADLDGDGNLDLYVTNYVDSLRICRSDDGRLATCDPSNFAAEQDRLYANRGDGTFADVTDQSGIRVADGKGLGLLVADLDNDFDPDIYVANDGTPNFLFRNDSQPGAIRLVEVAGLAGVGVNGEGQAEGGMGIACGDFSGQGRLDLLVTNFSNETNTLYENLGELFFDDATRASGIAADSRPLVGFGVQTADFDLDGRQDLIIANGHIDDFRFRGERWKMPTQVLRSVAPGRFREASDMSCSYFHGSYLGRGVARLDWDRDGDPDVIVVHQDAPLALLSNETPRVHHGLTVELRGTIINRDAIGASVEVDVSGRTLRQVVQGGDGFYASNERRLVFGLGPQEQVEQIRVRWPGGDVTQYEAIAGDCTILIVQGQQPRSL